MSKLLTGGCQCGRVRYSARIESDEAGLCHCRMCRRATGGFAAAIVQVHPTAVSWERPPDAWQSSPIARRLFCSQCGSPLGYATLDGEDMDLMLGSFDAPCTFVPVAHGGAESMLEAWLDTSALPRYRTEAIAGTVARWQGAGLEVPE